MRRKEMRGGGGGGGGLQVVGVVPTALVERRNHVIF